MDGKKAMKIVQVAVDADATGRETHFKNLTHFVDKLYRFTIIDTFMGEIEF